MSCLKQGKCKFSATSILRCFTFYLNLTSENLKRPHPCSNLIHHGVTKHAKARVLHRFDHSFSMYSNY
jgi:hypothetical protein